MKVQLGKDAPHGYRAFRGKAVWFHSAYTTKEEAVKIRDKEKKSGRSATIVEKYFHLYNLPKMTKLYCVYSANN